jgi:DNA-binding transcriptional ArsR family regulator
MIKICRISKKLESILQANFLKAIADPARQRIICVLFCEGALSAQSVSAYLSQERSVVSRHLKVLCEAGLLDQRKEGRHVYFNINRSSVIGYLEELLAEVKTVAGNCC